MNIREAAAGLPASPEPLAPGAVTTVPTCVWAGRSSCGTSPAEHRGPGQGLEGAAGATGAVLPPGRGGCCPWPAAAPGDEGTGQPPPQPVSGWQTQQFVTAAEHKHKELSFTCRCSPQGTAPRPCHPSVLVGTAAAPSPRPQPPWAPWAARAPPGLARPVSGLMWAHDAEVVPRG